MSTVDVTVRGAGVFGLSIAYACLRRGARVRVVDPHGVGFGASGGVVGALAPHTPENWNEKKAFQFESLLMAEAFWRDVDATSGGASGYERTGRLQPIADERGLDLARARAEEAKTLWQGKATWEVVPSAAATGWAPGSPTDYLIHDTLSARVHPKRAVESLAAAVLTLGGTLTTEAEDAGQVVWAAGYRGLEDLSRQFGKSVGTGVKGQALVVDYPADAAPQIFAEGLHIVPHADRTVAIGSTSEREFADPDATDDQIDDLHARAIAAMPVLEGRTVLLSWAGVRPRAKSRAPMLGAYPDRPGHFIANGGFKIGFGMAPKVAQIMADLVLEGRDAIPEGFRVEANL
ncbi:MAG: FAD-binding oxidoreductase [Rhodobacteraceae bacterium]|nr:FAD-binding oxidoreductase [Paracoccaceae bacterium]